MNPWHALEKEKEKILGVELMMIRPATTLQIGRDERSKEELSMLFYNSGLYTCKHLESVLKG